MSEHDAAIAEAERRLQETDSEIQRLRETFVDQAGPWLATKWRDTVQRAVREQHEHTQSLGRETLGTMKSELLDLEATAPALVRERVLDPSSWPEKGRVLFGRRVEDPLDTVLRAVLSGPVDLLDRYGYGHTEFERKREGWRYRYGFDVTSEMYAVLEEISDVMSTRWSVEHELAAARKSKAEAEAGDLWDQV